MGPFFGTTLLSVGAVVFALMNMDQEGSSPLLAAGLLFASRRIRQSPRSAMCH
jgi:uncharacterized membrane protein